MKVFIGTEEIAGVTKNLAEGFKALNHDVYTMVFSKNKYYSYDYNIVLSSIDENHNIKSGILKKLLKLSAHIRKIKYAFGILYNYDIYVFVWKSLLPNAIDYSIIKLRKKKIIHLFMGGDIRSMSAYKQQYLVKDEILWKTENSKRFNKKLHYLRLAEKYSDCVYSVPDQSGLAIRPYFHLNLPIEIEKGLKRKESDKKTIKIVHAPTKRTAKGTDRILEVLNNIKSNKFSIEIILLENVSNQKIKDILKTADLLVDELYLNGPGVLSLEAMARGCIVATKTDLSNKAVFNPPVIHIDNESIAEVLSYVVNNFEEYQKLRQLGIEYVQRNNSLAAVAENILYNLKKKTKEDYKPTFYLKQYLIPKNLRVSIRNKMLTNYLKSKYSS